MVRGYGLDSKWLRIRKMAIYGYIKENLEWNWTVTNPKKYIYNSIRQIYFQLVEMQIICFWKWVCGCLLGFGLENCFSIPGTIKRFFSSPDCPDRIWGPSIFIYIGYAGPFPGVKSGRCVGIITWLNLVPNLRISIAVLHNLFTP